jgi:hypothetical protein
MVKKISFIFVFSLIFLVAFASAGNTKINIFADPDKRLVVSVSEADTGVYQLLENFYVNSSKEGNASVVYSGSVSEINVGIAVKEENGNINTKYGPFSAGGIVEVDARGEDYKNYLQIEAKKKAEEDASKLAEEEAVKLAEEDKLAEEEALRLVAEKEANKGFLTGLLSIFQGNNSSELDGKSADAIDESTGSKILYYVFGGLAIVGAVVFIFAKKKGSLVKIKEEDKTDGKKKKEEEDEKGKIPDEDDDDDEEDEDIPEDDAGLKDAEDKLLEAQKEIRKLKNRKKIRTVKEKLEDAKKKEREAEEELKALEE